MTAQPAPEPPRQVGVILEVDGLRLVGRLFLPPGEGPHPGLTLCHGLPRGGPPEAGVPGYPELARLLASGGFAVLIFNFRGTGESQGNFDFLGWDRDLGAALDYLWARPEVDRGRLYVLGSSAGGRVAIYRAARDQRVAGVVACSTPFSWGGNPQGLLERARSIGIIRDPGFPSSVEAWARGFQEASPEKWVGLISPRPLLILHGEADDLVPVAQARKLFQAAGEPKEMTIIPGAGHRLRLEPRFMEAALAWLRRQAGLN